MVSLDMLNFWMNSITIWTSAYGRAINFLDSNVASSLIFPKDDGIYSLLIISNIISSLLFLSRYITPVRSGQWCFQFFTYVVWFLEFICVQEVWFHENLDLSIFEICMPYLEYQVAHQVALWKCIWQALLFFYGHDNILSNMGT